MFVTFLDVMAHLSETASQILVMLSKQIDFTGKSTRED